MVKLVIIHVRADWIKARHTRPSSEFARLYVEDLHECTSPQHVATSASHPSSNALFVFTVALWDAIAWLPLLPTVKQDYWSFPLLSSGTENLKKKQKKTKLIASTVIC